MLRQKHDLVLQTLFMLLIESVLIEVQQEAARFRRAEPYRNLVQCGCSPINNIEE